MTIGKVGHDYSYVLELILTVCLVETRERVCREVGQRVDQVELSMGMSGDFEHAILTGSTNIRVGSTIFGARVKICDTIIVQSDQYLHAYSKFKVS